MATTNMKPVSQNLRADTLLQSTTRNRMQSLDALRVLGTLFVILLHVAIAYLPAKFPGLLWAVHDPQPRRAISTVFWATEGMVMPLFFLIAGFCAGMMSLKMTAGEFLIHRRKRLLMPLLLGCVLILPLSLLVWTLGLVISGDIPASCLLTYVYPPAVDSQIRGLCHLWFLQYLLLYSIGFGGFLYWKQRKAEKNAKSSSTTSSSTMSSSTMERFFQSRWFLPTMLVLSYAVLWGYPEVVTGFQHGFLPFPAKFAYTIPFFVAGIAMSRQQLQLDRVYRNRNRHLLLAAISFPLMLIMIEKHLADGSAGWERIGLTASIVIFAWTTVLGMFGLFMKIDFPAKRVIGYLAKASFWVYLIHHPFVGLVQISLSFTSLVGEVKFLLTTLIVVGLSLGTYHVFIRQRWIGFLLGEKPMTKVTTTPQSTVESPALLPLPEPNPPKKHAA